MLSVVIITLDEEKRIADLLGDLANQSFKDFEVILVDSNSEDKTVEVAKTFDDKLNLKIEVMETRGVSLGRNTGASLAEREKLLFLDADVRLKPHFFRNIT